MAQLRFAPDDPSIPDNLRRRFERWDVKPPKSQFQQYGPLTAFLSVKFSPTNFLIKPQALLRELWDMPQDIAQEDIVAVRDILNGEDDHNIEMDPQDKENLKRRVSIDSQGFYPRVKHATNNYLTGF